MNAEELLTAPSSTLTRKQRRDRAALKRQLSATLPAGYMVGRVRVPDRLPGVEQTVVDLSGPPRNLGPLRPGSHVMVRMLDEQPEYAVGRP